MFEDVVLYHSVIDARCRFIRVFLAFKGIDFSLSAHEDWQTSKVIFTLNPARTMPIMKCSKTTIAGVYPILETVEENYAMGRMFGDNVTQRAENRRLLDWFFNKFDREVYTPIINVRYYKKTTNNVKALNTARRNIHPHLRYMTNLINNHICLNTENLGVADYCAGAYISSLDYFAEVPWDAYPVIKEWYQLMKGNPCFSPILENRIPSHTPPTYYTQADF